jgi:hypothetical protein
MRVCQMVRFDPHTLALYIALEEEGSQGSACGQESVRVAMPGNQWRCDCSLSPQLDTDQSAGSHAEHN